MNRRRLLQSVLLIAGLVAIAFVIAETVDQTQEQVLPSTEALVAAGVLAIVAIVDLGPGVGRAVQRPRRVP